MEKKKILSQAARVAKLSIFLNVFFVSLYLVCAYKIYYILNPSAGFFVWSYGSLVGIFLLSRLITAFYYTDGHGKKYRPEDYPSISFVIACKNEEESIGKTIDTCLKSSYPARMDCIAVNDGSTDRTWARMQESKRKWKDRLKLISFEKNMGKREAMAEGVLVSDAEVVIFVDSDSFVERGAARLIVEHFLEDGSVGAVAGNSLVENEKCNFLTRMQSARYGVSFDVFKSSESVFGAVTCCPGCFSAYRREAVLKVMDRWRYQVFWGTRSTFGDDRSLTNFILRDWKVVYCRKAVVRTIVPEKFPQFVKQQLRWKKSWIREGINAGRFMWRKNIIASLSFYVNLLIPIFAPLIAFRALFWKGLLDSHFPGIYLLGLVVMSIVLGLYYFFISENKFWWYVAPFSLIYSLVLIWQMPYAILKIRDTKWGTR